MTRLAQTTRRLKPIVWAALRLTWVLLAWMVRWAAPIVVRERWRLAFLVLGVVIPLLVIGELASEIFADEGFPWDTAALNFIREHMTSERMDTAMVLVTDMGRVPSMTVVCSVVLVALLVARRIPAAAFFLFGYFGAVLLNLVAKAVFRRGRPDLWASIAPEHTYSFPSGHAMSTAAFACAVIIVAWRTRLRWTAVLLAPAFALAVGFSRVYLGVHYPTDVVAGWLAGTCWVMGLYVVLMHRVSAGPGRVYPAYAERG